MQKLFEGRKLYLFTAPFLQIAPSQKRVLTRHGQPSGEDTRWNIVSAHTPVKRTPGKVTFSCFGSPHACFQWFPVPQALWRSKQSSPSSGSNICLSLTACSMAPGSLWLEHTMSFSVMSTEICSDNVKAFRSFGQLRFAASSGLHSRDDTAPCVTLSSLQFQQTPRAQRRVTRFYSHIVLLAFFSASPALFGCLFLFQTTSFSRYYCCYVNIYLLKYTHIYSF